jgi:Dynamin family
MSKSTQLEKRLHNLEAHLEQENPILLRAVASFRKLDKVSRRLGFLQPEESYATRISWWPMIAVLGTYSSGKSTFINHYLGKSLQLTGNQAVDDRFTVMCFSKENEVRVLPGLALDADPRFPFYQMSRAIEELTEGEGRRIDAYLQLKTCPSEQVRGKIIIDSPGFDADAQRTSTLRITNHIIDLSDLVLVFFDARHPEPGTMHDTLEHLVAQTINRPDSSKFLYILNQIDTTAREDNPEDVIASWQRALAQQGLTAGRFYRIYNPDAAIPIENDNLRQRFESKRDIDLSEIHDRMRQVGVDRAYRVVAVLEQAAHDIEERIVPRLQELLYQWRRRVLWLDGTVFGLALLGLIVWTLWGGLWDGWSALLDSPGWSLVALGVAIALAIGVHFSLRRFAAKRIMTRLQRQLQNLHERDFVEGLLHAFHKNTRFWRSIFMKQPIGWGARARRQIANVLAEANGYVQDLNDKFTNPSGVDKDAASLATLPDGSNDSLTGPEEPAGSELPSEVSTVGPNATR